MKIRCEYCGSFISDTDEKCPNCGAPNSKLMRSASGVPKTIAELEAFCRSHNMDLERMRFFLGKDVKEPRAFGIYQEEDGDFVVYKNKADGSRAVRYRGKDEAYAVNELYQKLRSELANRRNKSSSKAAPPLSGSNKRKTGPLKLIVLILLIILLVNSCVSVFNKTPNSGYYNYNGSYYYNDNSSWYRYDGHNEWYPFDVDDSLTDSYTDYWQGYDYDYGYHVPDFEASEYYNVPADSGNSGLESQNDDSDWDSDWDDSDWDFDYDSWDLGDTDWDSDW